MKKRILSLVLCAAMLLSMCLFLGAGVTNSLTVCDSSGEAVKRVDLPVNQKISLTAQAQSAAENDAYQWQIRAAKDVWANILGSDTQTLELSYPMVASALSEKNTVQIRCRLTSAETGEATFSDAVTVEVTAATAVDTPASADAAAAPVLRSPAKAAAAVNDAPEYGTYTIIINYQFTDGRQAANQWSATVANGTPFTQDVTSPTVVGYAPDLSVVHVDSSVATTYTVNYYPAEVEFTVKHYKQNVDNDGYTLSDTETKKGITESLVGANLATTYEGFYSLLYDTTTKIAADGSTVVEIYYDRYYYLMNFDLDGGYGVEPIYARYGAPINVGAPTKPGYTFSGDWDPQLPATMPFNGGTYTAKWTVGNAKYVVQYWQENANDDGYSYVEKVDKIGTVGTTVSGSDDKKNDKNYQGFTYNNEKTAKNVTIKGDGSTVVNVYYDRNVYTVKFYSYWYNYGYGEEYTALQITAKYGAKISDKWPTYNGSSSWATSDGGSTYQCNIDTMPLNGAKFYGPHTGSGSETAYYYVETLPGESGTVYNGVTYKEDHHDTSPGTGYKISEEDKYAITGFKFKEFYATKYGRTYYYNNAKFYYTRNNYELVYKDQYGGEVKEFLPYEQTLSESENYKKNYEPAYPSGSLEAGAYTFDGWYTDPGCTHPVDWTAKMPAANVDLYAKWAPVTHTVTTWLTDAMTTPFNVGETGSNEQTVNHRERATNPGTPINAPYTFVGWFYKDADGTEHAFDFSMPVTKELNLYAKWSSNTLMEYTIHYQLKNGTPIADDTKGSALAGSTKTFEAKTGDQLYKGYQSGYFPETSSHSIIMDIKDPTQNEYTFIYVPKPEVGYTVKYLEKGTEKQLADPKTVTTRDAVVTETFKQISGYAPDAYQKRLVLSANDKENVLTFWYTEDNEHAPVQIIHWTQNIAGDGYTEYQSSTNLNGVIGQTYSEKPLTIAGFTYNENPKNTVDGYPAKASGTLTEAGLVLNLYYDRIEYPYEFRFLEQGTDKVLQQSDIKKARYQAQVTETAPSIPGYTLVGDRSQSMVIQIEDPANEAKKNVKIFYYTEQTVDIKYQVVGPDGSGTLDNYQETQLKVLTGTAKGSAPTAVKGYKFVGWYEDADCTRAVNSSWVDNTNKLTPRRVDGVYKEATYYAKFERDVFDLTIKKTGEKIDQNQTFVFRVKGEDVDMQVVITGPNKQVIKNLPVGEYTITEDTSWSWKYTPVDKNGEVAPSQTITATGATTVTFENENKGTNWLTSLAQVINTWATGKAELKK